MLYDVYYEVFAFDGTSWPRLEWAALNADEVDRFLLDLEDAHPADFLITPHDVYDTIDYTDGEEWLVYRFNLEIEA